MYLDSILISHFKSGFSIIEFVLDMTGQIVDPRVIKSSGQQFDHLVLNSLDQLDLKNENIENFGSNIRYRLPVYFKNCVASEIKI